MNSDTYYILLENILSIDIVREKTNPFNDTLSVIAFYQISKNGRNIYSLFTNYGNTIDCDSRLKGIIDVLLQIYKFDLSTLGNCIGIDHKLIMDFLNDESSISISDKYHLSVRIMFLYYIIKYPDYTKIP